jgi:hypothetical protein
MLKGRASIAKSDLDIACEVSCAIDVEVVVGIQYAAYAIVEEAKTSGRDTADVTIVSIANSESGEILGTCPR